jgi:hypothetical protein
MSGRFLALTLHMTMIVTLTVGFSEALAQNPPNGPARAAQEDAIREAVLRYQMEGWARDGDKSEAEAQDANDKAIAKRLNARVYYLSVNRKDPSEELLKRFRDFPRTIKKVSESTHTKRLWVADKKTKQPGIIFSADEIHWITDDQVEVDGGYYCGGLCAAGDVFTVNFDHGTWKVTKAVMKWIS